MSRCLSVAFVNLYLSNRYSSYSYSPILSKRGIRDLRANTQKTVEIFFRNFAFKFFGEFLKF